MLSSVKYIILLCTNELKNQSKQTLGVNTTSYKTADQNMDDNVFVFNKT